MCATSHQLVDVYVKQMRSVLELAVPVWHSSLTVADKLDIERMEKAALHVIFGDSYHSYSSACATANLPTLEERRQKLCKKFALKSLKHPKHMSWYKVNKKVSGTRQKQPTFCNVVSRTTRFEKSPISYLTKILNKCWKP